ncbi:hypothetical protein ACF0H5_009334 [Mactra antiquata]
MVKFIEEKEDKEETKPRSCGRYNFVQNQGNGHVILSSINNIESQNRTANTSHLQQNYGKEVWGSIYQNRTTFVDMHLV